MYLVVEILQLVNQQHQTRLYNAILPQVPTKRQKWSQRHSLPGSVSLPAEGMGMWSMLSLPQVLPNAAAREKVPPSASQLQPT